MIDLAYVLGTAAFFALMLGYVHACARLGGAGVRDAGAPAGTPERAA